MFELISGKVTTIPDPWISVDDRLPKFLQKVLFHWLTPECNRQISMGYLCEEGWDIYLPYTSFKMHPTRLLVTHWRELIQFPEYSLEFAEKFYKRNSAFDKVQETMERIINE